MLFTLSSSTQENIARTFLVEFFEIEKHILTLTEILLLPWYDEWVDDFANPMNQLHDSKQAESRKQSKRSSNASQLINKCDP